MATPSSGAISINNIDTEFKIPLSAYGLDRIAQIAAVRNSSPYAFSDFYSKSFAGGVTSGLAIYLDAAHPSSGGGGTWYDISGNSNHYSGGGSFGGGYGGYYNFDGGANKTGNGINYNTNHTTEIWVRPQSSHEHDGSCSGRYEGVWNQKYVIRPTNLGYESAAGISVGTNGVGCYVHGPDYLPCLTGWSGGISSSLFYQVVVVYSGNNPVIYVNGSLVATGCTSERTVYAEMGMIGNGDYGYYTGDISILRHWGRSLSSGEVNTLFQTTRGRYSV